MLEDERLEMDDECKLDSVLLNFGNLSLPFHWIRTQIHQFAIRINAPHEYSEQSFLENKLIRKNVIVMNSN